MTRLRHLRLWVLTALLAAAGLRCSSDGGIIEPPAPASLAPISGNDQTAPAGEPLPAPLVVRVLDDEGGPAAGVTVQWSVEGGGSVSPSAVPTGSDGLASVTRVLGPDPGEQITRATVSGLQGSPVTFTATAVDGDSPVLVLATQPSGEAVSGAALAVQPAVQLQDGDGNDVAQEGLAVTASLATGSGTLGGTLTRTTDASGRATFTDLSITGPAGSYTLRFAAPGVVAATSNAIQVTASGGGSVVLITTNPPVGALDGEVFDPAAQPVIEVKDAGGAPVAGVQVTASLGSGGGTLEGGTIAATDAQGVARFLDLGIRGTGSHTLTFTAGSGSVTSSPVEVSALAPEASSGKWGPVVNWDIVPLHMALMPGGKIWALGKRDVLPDTMGMPRLAREPSGTW